MTTQAEGSTDVCEDSGVLCEEVYEWTDSQLLAEAVSWLVGKPLQIVIILVVAYGLNRFVRRWIGKFGARLGSVAAGESEFLAESTSERAEQRAASLTTLLRSASTAIVYTVAVILCLDVVGVSVVPVLASAGVAGLAIGFGAQRLVEDIITGLFMLIEDQFGVGDRIDVDLVDGTVENLTLRSTVIRDADGTLWHVPNSEIRRVANESQLWSRAVVDIGVAYGTETGRAMDLLVEAAIGLTETPKWADDVVEPPEVLGIQELGADAVNLRVTTRVQPEARRQFERELRQVLMDALDSAGVEMPNRQLDVWMRT
ncbi:MAG: mechanosensitive ion channel family protein [Acidimicrobiales bacterium]